MKGNIQVKKSAASFPKEWEVASLKSLGFTYGGLTNKSKDDFENGNRSFVSYRNIYSNTFVNIDELPSVNIGDSEKQNEVQKGDVLFTGSSETPNEVGMSSVLLENVNEVYLNSFSFGYRFNNPGIICPKFYGYYFRGDDFRREVFPLAQGSTRYNISKNELIKIKVPIPQLQEQHRIADILNSVDEAIEKTEAIIEQTEKVKNGLIQRLITKGIGHTKFKKTEIGEVPEEWSVLTLGDVTSESAFGPRFPADKYDLNGNYALLRTTDISQAGEINYETMPLANLPDDKFQKHTLEKGDLLVTRSGTCGIVCVFEDNNKPVIPGAFLIRFRINNLALPQFLRIFMMSDLGQSKIQTMASGGVQKNLSGTNLKKLIIPLPTRTEQKEIVETIKVFEDKTNNEKRFLQQLHGLKAGLMQSLLTGKVRVKVEEAEVTQV